VEQTAEQLQAGRGWENEGCRLIRWLYEGDEARFARRIIDGALKAAGV
jgi:hypothetical protein